MIEVRNPHSILAALEQRPRAVKRVSIPPKGGAVWDSIVALCEKHHIGIDVGGMQTVANSGRNNDRNSERNNDRKFQGKGAGKPIIKSMGGRETSHGMALIEPKAPVPIEDLFTHGDSDYGIWVATDCLQDPQNLGTVFRLASFFGVRGILTTSERSVPMTSTVYDVSCGGVETVKYAEAINLKRALDEAKKNDIWILGTSEHAKDSLWEQKLDRNWLVVVGSEENGMRRLTTDSCDVVCGIPMGDGSKIETGSVGSLNVSVATGVVLSWFRGNAAVATMRAGHKK